MRYAAVLFKARVLEADLRVHLARPDLVRGPFVARDAHELGIAARVAAARMRVGRAA